MSIWATFLLGVAVRHIICGFYLFIYLFFLPVMLSSEIPKLPTDSLWECFLVFGNFSSFKTSFPGQISVPASFVSLFIFYILSYLLSKTMGCLSGCLMSSSSIRKFFRGICSAFKCSLDEFVGEKVVSLSYSSAILGPPLRLELSILSPQQAHFPFCSRPRLQMELDWIFMCLFVFLIFPLIIPATLLPFQYCPIDISFSE